jgi:hypothetical protein
MTKNTGLSISSVKLEKAPNPKLGFYTVGEQVFYIKSHALIESTKSLHFPQWNFNNEVYEKLDWLVEPEIDIKELYKIRAQQLREKYDYIRVEASGGGDSTTVIYSFLLNGIHLDEVVFRYPKLAEKGISDDPFNTKPENTLSEYTYAAKPLLHWIKTNYPDVKITIHDYSEYILNENINESWILKGKDYFQLAHVYKHDAISLIDHRRQADQGKNICVLFGIDKPKICIKDKNWYAYFFDGQANHSNIINKEYDNITNEYFYWTPDLPDIVRKQAHIVKNWFSVESNKHLQHLVRWPNYSIAQRSAFEAIIKPLIYPDYDPSTFQTAKPTNSFYNEMDYWFRANFQDTKAYQVQQAGIELLVDKIDPKWFNYQLGKPVGFMGFISPFYCLGPAEYKSTGINDHSHF